MTPTERSLRLAHDVGKYIARIARNVPAGEPVPSALVPLLIRDLYERPGESFEELAEGLEHASLDEARVHLKRLSVIESAVRQGQPEPCTEACGLALAIESALAACAEAHR